MIITGLEVPTPNESLDFRVENPDLAERLSLPSITSDAVAECLGAARMQLAQSKSDTNTMDRLVSARQVISQYKDPYDIKDILSEGEKAVVISVIDAVKKQLSDEGNMVGGLEQWEKIVA
ncbi:MAG: hypothetical protein NT141_00740 [candidate division WWE3 bacterium]|nr:hypothetical protein [candidate division WWE3 bacterium]